MLGVRYNTVQAVEPCGEFDGSGYVESAPIEYIVSLLTTYNYVFMESLQL